MGKKKETIEEILYKLMVKADSITGDYARGKEAELYSVMETENRPVQKALAFKKWKDHIISCTKNLPLPIS